MYLTEPLPSISLFTGAGGLDLGLELAGFQTNVAVEIEKWSQATLNQNRRFFRRNDFPLLGDITKYSPYDLLEAAGLAKGEAVLVAGGPPCQSFSTAGRRGSIQDPRGSLFANFASVVNAAQPRFFVMENVRGMLSAAVRHRPLAARGPGFPELEPEEEQGSAFKIIRGVLEEELGYQLTVGVVDAADYGVPQNRQRLILLGSREHEFKTAQLDHILRPTFKGNWRTLRWALSHMAEEPPRFIPYTVDRHQIMDLVPSGMNWRWFRDNPDFGPDVAQRLMGGAWKADGGKVGFYRRLRWDKPSPTLPTSPIQKSTFLCHPMETRPLSVQEYAAIQQFPVGYEFAGGLGQQYKQIGNAVPVGLAEAIGRGILFVMQGQEASGQKRLLETGV